MITPPLSILSLAPFAHLYDVAPTWVVTTTHRNLCGFAKWLLLMLLHYLAVEWVVIWIITLCALVLLGFFLCCSGRIPPGAPSPDPRCAEQPSVSLMSRVIGKTGNLHAGADDFCIF